MIALSSGATIGIIVGVLVLLAILISISTYNGLVRARNHVDNAWSQIDVQLKRRHDLIPNLIETVKGYAKHEQETFDKVIQARNAAMNAASGGPVATAQAENALSGTLKSLFALSEAYPDLKANQNFLSLQEELTSTEDRIAYARQFYNDRVLAYNNKCQTFPSSIFAGMFNFTTREFFEAPPEETAPVKVEF